MLKHLSRLALFAAALTLTLPPVAATAQSANCAARAIVVEHLASRFGETRQSIGLGPSNAVMEVFASSDTGTWTIIVTNASGLTCLVARGRAFERMDEQLPDEGEDA